MPEMHISQYLKQIDHCLEGLEEPGNEERAKEIAAIRKKVREYQVGIQRVDTKNMVLCIMAGLEELAPRIEKLVVDETGNRPTWPAPASNEL